MATVKRFEDLEIWQKSRILCQKIYQLTKSGTFAKDYKLRDQVDGSSSSMMDNVAEGFDRGSRNEFVYFLGISKGSAGELKSQLYRALDRGHINKKTFDELYKDVDEISKMINGLITYLNKSDLKGGRYKVREIPMDLKSKIEYNKPKTENRKSQTGNRKQ